MAYFVIEESPTNQGKYLVKPNFDNLPLYSTTGSYAVVMARTFGVSFANYLRLCRDEYGAEIVGKGSMYPTAYFTNRNKAQELVNELEKRVRRIKQCI